MKNHEISTVGLLIEQKRRAKGLSQDDLAHKCNITSKALSNIERDKNLPSTLVLVKLARALDMRGHELLKEIEEKGLLEYYLRKKMSDDDKKL